MRIDELIRKIKPHLPFETEGNAVIYLANHDESDRIALVSAMYFGRSHLHSQLVNEDHYALLFSGEMNRFWQRDDVQDDEIAKVLYQKSENLTEYYNAFLRCIINSGYDLNNY